MLDQIFELSRKATESSLQMQQLLFKHLTQDWQALSPTTLGADCGANMGKRLADATIETLNKQRETIDSAFKAGIQTLEQLNRISEAKSADERVRTAEDVWRKLFDAFKGQAETQFREFQTMAEKSFEMAHKPDAV
jgi:hypothetical protein